jgi:hypothetical protein
MPCPYAIERELERAKIVGSGAYPATLLAKCDGLAGQQLITRSCEPSPMSFYVALGLGTAEHVGSHLWLPSTDSELGVVAVRYGAWSPC